MSRTKILLATALVSVFAGAAYFASITRAPAAPSVDLTAPPVEPPAGTEPVTPAEPVTAGETRYRIVAAESKVSFELDEVLRGEPFTVVGTTNQVSGEIFLNAAEPSKSRVGEIRINARTLATDSRQRDGAISRMILKSSEDANEFIVFTPTAVEGLPAKIETGVSFAFRINGDLTISGITKPVTFGAKATLREDGKLAAEAVALVDRADYKLAIPNIPFVANVEERVELSIDLVAEKA